MKSSFLVLLFQITDSLEIVCIDLAIFQAGIWLNIIIKFNYFYIPASCFQLWNYYIIYDLSMWTTSFGSAPSFVRIVRRETYFCGSVRSVTYLI